MENFTTITINTLAENRVKELSMDELVSLRSDALYGFIEGSENEDYGFMASSAKDMEMFDKEIFRRTTPSFR